MADAAAARPESTGASSSPRGSSSSSAYAALEERVAATEASFAALQAQVNHLSAIVKAALPDVVSTPPASAPAAPARVFSPFDPPASPPSQQPAFQPIGTAPRRRSPTPSTGAAGAGAAAPGGSSANAASDSSTIAALTQQIAALSTSVAQLQRLQSHNAIAAPPPPLGYPASSGGPLAPPNGHPHGGHSGGPGQGPPGPPGPSALGGIARQMTAPLDSMAGPGPLGPHASLLSPGGGRGEFGGPQRGPNNRPFSTNMLVDDNKWGAPPGGKFGAGPGSLGNLGGGPSRDWQSSGPGPLMGTPPNGVNTGAAAPGAGIVVTKWEHLNLKVELLRSIAKYGIGPPNKIQARVLPFMLKGSDIIAQAPPTQERIISYVIPALQLCLSLPPPQGPYRGPAVIIITTTVDQATQCHKLVRNVGGPLGVRSALAAGAAGSGNLAAEVGAMGRDAIQMLIGTPAKINEVMSARGALSGNECRLLILDEVDQLIARNLYENVLSVARLLPSPRRPGGNLTPGGPTPFSPVVGSPYDNGQHSPFNPQSKTPFPSVQPSRFSTPGPNGAPPPSPTPTIIDRQTCLFSNTIPTDVINFSQTLQVRDPVRVLVRREGSTNSQESVSSITPGINLKHTYVYLTITGSARTDESSADGPGTIGSGRANAGGGGAASEEATRAKEYKLDMLVKILDDYPLWQAVIHVGTYSMLEAVVYKLSGRNWETLYLASDMPPSQKKAVLQQWRSSHPGQGPRFLVCFDVNPKPPDIPWTPLVVNFDLPRSVEGYALRAAAAVSPAPRPGQPSPHVNGVVVSFVQAAGGDVEMLRSTECAYRFKSAEIPTVFHDLFQH
ncbi:hypothetical protein Q8F55_001912 [Vanrija albida]|uniref:RNA helicase n=1 Tax=Vanrija albida TaxID=181172 RepID=A0ABR3Q8A7_9TREE